MVMQCHPVPMVKRCYESINYAPHCRKLRQRDVSKFHIQLCVAQFCLLIVFVSGIEPKYTQGGCVTASVLIHYFTLVFWMWMGAVAVLMFQKLVIVFVNITVRYIVAVSLTCWCKLKVPKLKSFRLPVPIIYTMLCCFSCSGSDCTGDHPCYH